MKGEKLKQALIAKLAPYGEVSSAKLHACGRSKEFCIWARIRMPEPLERCDSGIRFFNYPICFTLDSPEEVEILRGYMEVVTNYCNSVKSAQENA